jgi:hypothetical protein
MSLYNITIRKSAELPQTIDDKFQNLIIVPPIPHISKLLEVTLEEGIEN